MAGVHVRYLFLVAFVPVLFTCQSLTDFFISDEQEVEMGNKFKAEILADTRTYPRYTRNSEVINYISAMGQAIVRAQSDRNITFTFTLIDNDTMINAFAIPGGHVFLYTGLLKAARSGAEVAGVIAHEVGHITMRHGANQLMKASAFSVVNQVLFGDSSSVAGAVANICANLLFLKYSRDDEYQADSCAVAYAVAVNYNPYGIVHFFQTLVAKYGNAGSFEALSTHPSTDTRISEVRRIIGKTPGAPSDDGTTNMHTTEFAAIQAKI